MTLPAMNDRCSLLREYAGADNLRMPSLLRLGAFSSIGIFWQCGSGAADAGGTMPAQLVKQPHGSCRQRRGIGQGAGHGGRDKSSRVVDASSDCSLDGLTGAAGRDEFGQAPGCCCSYLRVIVVREDEKNSNVLGAAKTLGNSSRGLTSMGVASQQCWYLVSRWGVLLGSERGDQFIHGTEGSSSTTLQPRER